MTQRDGAKDITFRKAGHADLKLLHPMIERAYRGDSARRGWTHEADLLFDTRTNLAELEAIVADPNQVLLSAWNADRPVGCVNVADRGGGLAYLGMLCIEPDLQAAGLGRRLIAAAESHARVAFDADRIEMAVIDTRTTLIAWYERRGYIRTAEIRDFPVPLDPPYFMAVLVKSLV